jgi:predicted  nucleic acid-binding Zn-ribbon protein
MLRRFEVVEDSHLVGELEAYLERTSRENLKVGDEEHRINTHHILKCYESKSQKLAEFQKGGPMRKAGETQDGFTQTDGAVVSEEEWQEATQKYKDLQEEFAKLRSEHDELMEENSEVQKHMKLVEEEAYAHQEAIENANSALNAEKRKVRQLDEEKESIANDMKEKLDHWDALNEKLTNLQADCDTNEQTIKEGQEALDNANLEIENLRASLNEANEFKEKDLQAKQAELDEIRAEADTANKKIEELLKGGDYADEQLRIHIEEMEDAVEVLKTGKQKWKTNYKELKEEFDKLKGDNEELTDNQEQMQEKITMLNLQMEKLKAFVKDATERDDSEGESEDDDNGTNTGKVQTDDKSRSGMGKSLKAGSLHSEHPLKSKTNPDGTPMETDGDDLSDISGTLNADGSRRKGRKSKKSKLKLSED